MDRVKITTTLPRQDRDPIKTWAGTRGFTRLSDLIRVALFEYIRRRLPKNPVTVPQQRLKDIVEGGREEKSDC